MGYIILKKGTWTCAMYRDKILNSEIAEYEALGYAVITMIKNN
jgi:hypothetical protein